MRYNPKSSHSKNQAFPQITREKLLDAKHLGCPFSSNLRCIIYYKVDFRKKR